MATATKTVTKTGNSRLFVIDGGAGAGRVPQYIEMGHAGQLRWPQTEPTDLEVPDPDTYDNFIIVDQIKGARQKPSIPWVNRRAMGEVSVFQRLREKECRFDMQVHYGVCQSPRDFDGGYSMVDILEGALTDYNTDALGAMQSSERNPVNENGTATGQRFYTVVPLTYAELAGATITVEIIDVTICDSASCAGACGDGSDGCQKIFALSKPTGTDPGDEARVFYSADGGSTWGTTIISALAAADNPNRISCVGQNLIVTSAAGEHIYWTPIADVLAGTAVWAAVAGGIVTAKGPTAIVSLGPTLTWIGGLGGYIYFSDNPESDVAVQDAGNATVQDILAIDAIDAQNVVAVGKSNAIVRTANGGASWGAVTGPASGVDLNCVAMKSPFEWYVGTNGGRLFVTHDAGFSWTEIGFSGSGSGKVLDIVFSTNSVGYMAVQTTGTKGKILRTINGGESWVIPSGANAIGQNDRINALATCADPNRVFGAGLADNGTDGYLTVGA